MTEFQIFKSCFPELKIDESNFNALAFSDDTKLFREGEGFAVCRNDRITLLCVSPKAQKKGIGSSLLAQCEQHIKSSGSTHVSVGGNMLIGAVSESSDFFRKHGYSLSGDFTEMELPLKNFTVPQTDIPQNAEFRFYDGDIDSLRKAVAEVDEEWVQYFDEDGCFFCCFMGGELASFCIVGDDERCLLSDGASKVGSIGCVGTVPKFRRKGLGLQMVALAAEWLKGCGCDSVFIHYTHLYNWYAKLGAEVFLRFTTAEKEL